MRRYSDLKLFYATDGLRYPSNIKNPFALVYFSENSTLIEDFPKLKILRQDIKYVMVPTTRIPRTRLTAEDKVNYKSVGLFAISDLQKIPKGHSIIIDLSKYFKTIDEKYKPTHYRQRIGVMLQAATYKAFKLVPDNYHRCFIYSVDNTKPVNKYINKKIFPFLQTIKDGNFPYSDFLYIQVNEAGSEQRFIIKDRKTQFGRIVQYLKKVGKSTLKEENHETAKKTAISIVNKIKEKNISDEKKEVITKAVIDYLEKNPDEIEKYQNEETEENATEIVTASILSNVSGETRKSQKISHNISKEKKKDVLKLVVDRYIDEILPKEKAMSNSTDVAIQEMNLPEVLDDKSPEHLFTYRQKNIETNLKKDIYNTFKILENREGGLKVEEMNIIDKPSQPGELLKSDIQVVVVVLRDERNKKHTVKIEIPKINEFGVFTVNGRTKCLINQIVQLPITFPKPFDSKFESTYNSFHIVSKKERAKSFLQIFIGSYKLPLFIVMASRFGLEHVCKLFDMKYTIEEKNKTDVEYKIKLKNKQYIYFHNINSILKKELFNSLEKGKVSTFNIDKEVETPEFFNDVILKTTKRVNSVYRIQSSFDNIIDPIVKQILMNQQLPTSLDQIMKYMASKVVEGFVILRNDLSNERIRNSEIIAQLLQNQVHTAYTTYKEQLLAGNENAKFEVPPTKVMTEFVNSEIVANMEYANPVEEMSVMTRVSPVGSNIGGIPDKRAVGSVGRDVSDTYFGNIDPLDTPEGDNIGIIQHLSVDAVITSTRGIFQKKPINDKEYAGTLSTSTCLIPFVANDDGTRVMFGANQARQSLPLKNPEPPLIQSGYESILTRNLSDNFVKKAKCDGVVTAITKKEITLKCKDGKTEKIDIQERHLTSGAGKNTLSVFKPIIKVGDKVKTSQIVAEGSCVKNGSISVGKTLCTAVVSWKGYNFEDGIVVSDALQKSEKLTSLHGIIEEVEVSLNDKILDLAKPGTFIKKGDIIFRKVIGDISELLGHEDEVDELSEVSGGQYIKKSPGATLISIEVYSNDPLSKNLELLKPYLLATRKKYKMKDDDLFYYKREKINKIIIKFIMEQEMGLQIGDKLSNRHGAKGIVSLIEKEENMPITPWGERVEIIVNPIGIINRMNVGQLYELYAGLISKTLGRKIIELKSKDKIIALLKSVLPILDKTKDKLLSTTFISKLNRLPQTKFNKFIEEIKNNKGFTLIIPPFKEPKHADISKALKILGLSSSYILNLPEYNIKTLNPVPLGYMYFEKLEHIATDKLTARSTGPMTGKTMQPTAGKKREGGQRIGEMDVYSMLSYNAKTVITELFGPMSDDINSKNEYIANIIKDGHTPFIYSGHTASKDLLNNYMVSLMLTR